MAFGASVVVLLLGPVFAMQSDIRLVFRRAGRVAEITLPGLKDSAHNLTSPPTLALPGSPASPSCSATTAGIGPEMCARILSDGRMTDAARLVVVGDARVLATGHARMPA